MKKENVVKIVCIAGGLLGIGIIAHQIVKGKREDAEEQKHAGATVLKTEILKPKPAIPKPKMKVVKTKKPVPEVKPSAPKPQTKPKKPVADEFPLQLGSKGKNVERLQIYLLRNYGWAGIVTGIYDEKVQERVMKYLKVTSVSEALFNSLDMNEPITSQHS
ncbi:hypothetical protein LX97_00525 [Nonlabens dokdonensis]|jgi:hypothetical protein|uniref:Uncharacterized protein n=2 Tax=Nonlabens dokdonensis TaxID=328515 RepID=L7W7V1_NONDD|nr:peptidoglycan-binding protein [Nonlabens dokdonensis]AGC75841.1 hypothetical protein DDD_0714 [Nonlabens dokdonensis DSW-6]PZX43524.1 hypothetical protein LX97_00525 [Nonlabens dokdonensis]